MITRNKISRLKKNIGVCTLRIFHFLLFININAKKMKLEVGSDRKPHYKSFIYELVDGDSGWERPREK